MAFGVKFTPLTPTTQLHSRRVSLVDVTNASSHFSSEEINKAIQYVDAVINDFYIYSQNCVDNNHSESSLAQGSTSRINTVDDDEMEVDTELASDDVFPDLTQAFLESFNPQHCDDPFSLGDQFSQFSPESESTTYDISLARMAELGALLLETFPDGMPEEIDYQSILADQHIPSDPLDPSFWNYFQGSDQAVTDSEHTPNEQ